LCAQDRQSGQRQHGHPARRLFAGLYSNLEHGPARRLRCGVRRRRLLQPQHHVGSTEQVVHAAPQAAPDAAGDVGGDGVLQRRLERGEQRLREFFPLFARGEMNRTRLGARHLDPDGRPRGGVLAVSGVQDTQVSV
jgi:hypothetical protein